MGVPGRTVATYAGTQNVVQSQHQVHQRLLPRLFHCALVRVDNISMRV